MTFDIGGTTIKYGLIDESGHLIRRKEMPTLIENGGRFVISQVIEKIMITKLHDSLSGVAISTAGVVDPKSGIVLATTSTFKDYAGINIKSIIESETGIYTTIENDVNCAALAESIYGENQPKNFIAMTIGTGIGGAIIISGEVYHGASHSAGEWGRMIFNGNSFEETASTSSIVRLAQSKGLNVNSGKSLFEFYDNGDAVAIDVVKHFYDHLACGIRNLVYALNPSLIIIGGGISNRGQKFIDELYRALDKQLESIFRTSLTIRLATLKNDSGMLGAYVHHMQQKMIKQ